MDKELGDCNAAQKTFRTDLDVLGDKMMDMEMSAQGAHCMIAEMKEEVRDFSDSFGNLHNQVETMRVEDITWCRSRISVLEKPNNPANKSLWTLVNLLVRRVDDQADQIKDLKAGLALGGERVSHWGQGVVSRPSTSQIHCKEMDKGLSQYPPRTFQGHSEFSQPI
jgi:hypothetical protein